MTTVSRRTDTQVSKEARLQAKKLALIGAGKIGEALLSGILTAQLLPASRLEATDADPQRAEFIGKKYGIRATIVRRSLAPA